MQNIFNSKTKINFRKLKQIGRQEYESSVLYPLIYLKTIELDHISQVLVQINQLSLQKLFILLKSFPFLTQSSWSYLQKKKRAENRKWKTVQNLEKNFCPKGNTDIHEHIGKNQTIKIDRKSSK